MASGAPAVVNRTAGIPLALFILAGVVVPMPVKRIVRWAEARPTVQQCMAARGLALESPTLAKLALPRSVLQHGSSKEGLPTVTSLCSTSRRPVSAIRERTEKNGECGSRAGGGCRPELTWRPGTGPTRDVRSVRRQFR